jgi:hypothetical protein
MPRSSGEWLGPHSRRITERQGRNPGICRVATYKRCDTMLRRRSVFCMRFQATGIQKPELKIIARRVLVNCGIVRTGGGRKSPLCR